MGEAGPDVELMTGLNVLVGENDWVIVIIDAIKTVLGTNSHDLNWGTVHKLS